MKSTFEAVILKAFNQFENLVDNLKDGHDISFSKAAGIASNLTVSLMQPIFAQMNPEKIGNYYRALNIAYILREVEFSNFSSHFVISIFPFVCVSLYAVTHTQQFAITKKLLQEVKY